MSGNQKIVDTTHVMGAIITNNSVSCFDGYNYLWIDGCTVNEAATATFYNNKVQYFTWNTFSKWASGLHPFSTVNSAAALVRGNIIRSPSSSQSIFPYTLIGNLHDITNSQSGAFHINEFSGQTQPRADGTIVAFNRVLGFVASDKVFGFGYATNQTFGIAFVQNLVEWWNSSQSPGIGLCADASTSTDVENVLLWNNTIVGTRGNLDYNETGSTALWRSKRSKKNNNWDDDNIKSDLFTTANGNRIGNWSEVWGVGHSGNFLGNVNNIGAQGFSHTNSGGLPGLNSIETETSLAVNYQQFVANNAYSGAANGPGFGTYRMKSTSPLIMNNCEWLLPYDIEGNARGGFDPPGAYASASPRKGAGFFQ